MLSVVYITHRGLYPITDGPGKALGQYGVLAQSLLEQRYGDFELLVVDQENELPRHELATLKQPVRYLRPRVTPWLDRNTFCANSARNTALVHARGSTVVTIDDCFSLPPQYLEAIAKLAAAGTYTAAHIVDPSWPERPNGSIPADQYGGGILSYPLEAAIEVNGMDERFDGAYSGGDIDFFQRLRLVGVDFVRHPDVYVTGYPHGRRNCTYYRCHHLAWEMAQERHRRGDLEGNVAWSEPERQVWETCGRPGVCAILSRRARVKTRCIFTEPEDELTVAARREYESTRFFDLREERRHAASRI